MHLKVTQKLVRGKKGPRFWALLAFCVLAAPTLAAIWSHRWFVTQDGPIYLYNTHILVESLKSNNPFADYYSMRWLPVPYWGVYIVLGALTSVFSERASDHLMVSITSVGFFASLLWLRSKVRGRDCLALAAPLAALLSINMLWLTGFYNFLFGVLLYAITLGVWWSGRDDFGPKRALYIAGLLVAGYLCHPVSLGMTVTAVTVLAVTTPGAGWRRRLGWTAISFLPLVPLALFYRHLMRSAGTMTARWTDLTDPSSLNQWLTYIRGANIISLAYNEPNLLFGNVISSWSHLPPVTNWAVAGLILFLLSALLARKDEGKAPPGIMRGWILLSTAWILLGLIGPDDIGEAHGGFLRERLLLFGLATLFPALKLNPKRFLTRMGAAPLLIAVLLQSLIVWNYAAFSSRLAEEFMQAKPHTGTGQRIAVLLVNPEDEYAANPLTNISNLLGVDTGNVVWNNYAPALYYFPIQFRDETNSSLFYIRGIPAFTDQGIPGDELDDWAQLLSEIESKTDVLVVWGGTPELDEINSDWFEDDPVFENDNVRVFKHRQGSS